MIEVQIREDRMVLVNDKMEAIAKQAARIQKRTGLTLDLPTVTVTGEEFRTVYIDSNGRKVEPNAYHIVDEYIEKWLNVTVTGGSIAIPGWEFVAVIEHADAGNIIRGIRDDIDTSAYRHTPSECVHCNLSRNRNDTYLVLETATGQLRQVGSDCIKDYTGGLDPKAAAAMAAWVSDLMEMINEGYDPDEEERGRGGGSVRSWLRVDHVLQAAACVVRTQGYVKSRDEWGERNPNATVAVVENDYLFARGRADKIEQITDEDIATAAAAKEWGAALIDGDNEFSHNVGVLCSSEYVTIKNLGILCYVPEGLRRDIERKAREAAKADSVFYGAVGEKFTEPVTVVDANRVIESMYVSYLQTFVTDNGAVLKWFASRDQSINVGDRVTLSGTVKAHKEFRGAKETAVTRCKLNA